MSYATVDDLKARLGDVYDAIYEQDADAGEDLADAQAEIDGCIGRRYDVPVTAAASLPLLKGWMLTLCEERSYSRAAGSSYAEKVATRVAQVRKYLEAVMQGDFTLPGAEEKSSGGGVTCAIAGDPPVFTRDGLRGY